MVAIKGAEKIMPIIPNMEPKTKIEKRTDRGCKPSLSPINFGVKKLDSNSSAAKYIKDT